MTATHNSHWPHNYPQTSPHRVLLLRDQRSAALSFRANKIKNTLFSCLKEWFAVLILEKDSDEKLSSQINISLCKRKRKRIFRSWLNSIQEKTESSTRHYQTRILRNYFQEWRLLKTVRLLHLRLGAVCGVLRVYQKRSFQSWISVWRKRKSTAYAVNLLQLTFDRVTARRALLKWPGCQQYRNAEEFRVNLMQKKRVNRGYMLQVIEMFDKNKENRKEEKEEKGTADTGCEGPWTLQHLKMKDCLSLAQRVALEASNIITRESQDNRQQSNEIATLSASYTLAVAAAKSALLDRAGRAGRHHTGHISGDLGASSASALGNLDFFLGSLRCSKTREEEAVKELLLLLQIVLIAWSKAAKTLLNLRVKGRMLRRSVNKRCLAGALRRWTSRTSSTTHRVACWILPRSAVP